METSLEGRSQSRTALMMAAVAATAMALFQAQSSSLLLDLRYERTAVLGGEYWRLITGHFVHLGWQHLLLNVAGLGIGAWLFGGDRGPGAWVMATLASAIVCGLGLLIFSPHVAWCVGLSGILHGLMVVGFGGWILGGDRVAWLFLGAVVLKVGWEQLGGDMPWAGVLAGGRVITEAHLWGGAGGAMALAIEVLWQRRTRPV